MKLKSWKKFSIYSISIFSLVAIAIQLAAACADGFYEIIDSFFAPEVIKEEKYTSFFRSMNPIYDGYGGYHKRDYIEQFDTLNVEEWSSFFGDKVKSEDLHFLLYKSRLGEIDTLIFYTKNASYPVKPYLKSNSINAYPDKGVVKEFLYYLGFAKRCSKFCTPQIDYWSYDEDKKVPDFKELTVLLNGGVKQVKSVKSSFIKERYFFQIVRLNFFKEDYPACISYFEAHKDSFPLSASMKYRSMSYAAGALDKSGRTADANLLFARIYDQFDPLKETAFMSFAPKEELDWKTSLTLAESKRDKAVLWHLSGIKNDGLRAMREIYVLDPKSDLLDLLLVRAINIEEESILPVSWYSLDSSGYKIRATKLNGDLIKFVTDLAVKENTSKPYLWNLSAGYLHTLAGNGKKAEPFLVKAAQQAKGDKLAEEQIRIIRVITKVQNYLPSDKNEADIVKELKWLDTEDGKDGSLRNSNVYSWAVHRLAEIYDLIGDKKKAYCLNSQLDVSYLRDNEFLEAMIGYLNKPAKTEFDEFAVKVYPYNEKVLRDMQGVNLLYEYKLEDAKKKFLQAGAKSLESNPFTIRIKDCRDCDQEVYDGSYDNLKFINEMLDLEQKAKSNPSRAFDYYFKLANGYYNMTYFGNSRNLFINEAYNPGLFSFYYDFDELGKYKHLLDCSKAEEYYIKAMNATTDKDLKAKCAFMASKCEQNQFFISIPLKHDRHFRAGKYFKLLKEQYATTNYYKEIIRECGYFKTYINK